MSEVKDIAQLFPEESPKRIAALKKIGIRRVCESVNSILRDALEEKGYPLVPLEPGVCVVDEHGARVENDAFTCKHRKEYFEIKNGEKVPLRPYKVYMRTDSKAAVLTAIEERYELHEDKVHEPLVKFARRALKFSKWAVKRLANAKVKNPRTVEKAREILKELEAQSLKLLGTGPGSIYRRRHGRAMEFKKAAILNLILPSEGAPVRGKSPMWERVRRKHERHIKRAAEDALARGVPVMSTERSPEEALKGGEIIHTQAEAVLAGAEEMLVRKIGEIRDELAAPKSKEAGSDEHTG